ncbi:MAG TPA: class I SAM-dependent methyltransferase [Edaphocola sp.]|nr:class I SAM-dependent methyltransferase [Edaphocola sp.]
MTKIASEPPLFEADNLSVMEAIDKAQTIAFAPYIWEVTRILKEKGLLACIEVSGREGRTIGSLAEQQHMSVYAVRVLLEAGLGIGLVYRKDDKYFLAKTGHIFLNHPMTVVNYDFMRNVCVAGAADMEASLDKGRPEGLKHFGQWPTIYEGLSALPEQAQKSWFAFDHFYSDNAFPEALEWVFEQPAKRILDIGGNTGRWTLKCLAYDNAVHMGIVDLPGQLNMARENIATAGYAGRVSYWEADMLREDDRLPEGFDVIWMSQFLDCFSEQQIIDILKKCFQVASRETRVIINETFWDKQRFETSAFALQMTSLYFTTMANGNSQMYDSKVFKRLIEAAGFRVVKERNLVGIGHTLWELRKHL